MLLNESESQKQSKRKFKKYLEMSENNNTTYQNICDTAKAELAIIAISAHMNKSERHNFIDHVRIIPGMQRWLKKCE